MNGPDRPGLYYPLIEYRREVTYPYCCVPYRAAFEKISTIKFVREGEGQSDVDVRTARLRSTVPPNYDPRDNREPRVEIRPWMAYFNLLRTMLGPGLLGIPVAISASGLWIGTSFVFFIGVLVIHTHHLLLKCLVQTSAQLHVPHISYRYGFRLALLHGPRIFHVFGRNGPVIIALFQFLSQLGICTVCVIFTADSLRDIADFQSVNPALLALLPCYLLMEFYMMNLNRISYVTLFGNACNLVGLVLLFYHIFKEPLGEVIWFEDDLSGWLFSIGLCLFNLSAVGVVLTLDKALKQPRIMTSKLGVVNVGLGIPTGFSMLIGSLSCWAFGTMEENVLRSLPFDDTTSMIIIGVYLISVGLSFPLQCYPGVEVILEVIKYHDMQAVPDEETLKVIAMVLRPTFVLLTFAIAYNVPFQGPFVAFVGNLCSTMICVVFPVMMDISLRYNSIQGYGRYNFHLIKDVIILIWGVVVWILGVYYCGYIIYIRILSRLSPNASHFF